MAETHFGEETIIDSGSIVMWSGLLSDIPSGWVICDGNNGTPNLLGDFVKGHGDATVSPGSTGGADTFSLSTSQLPSHSHDATTTTDGSHNHTYHYNTNVDTSGSDYEALPDLDTNIVTQYAGSHTHSVDVATTGSGNAIDNKPEYFEVAYIMKT